MSDQSLDHAVQLHLQGNLAQAKSIYLQTLQIEPDNADALHLLGVVAFQERSLDEALMLIKKAIGLRSKIPDYHNNLGNVYLALGQPAEAIACYQRALELNPGFSDAHNNLGNALKDQGKQKEAVICYQRALRWNPNSAKVHKNLGIVLKELGQIQKSISAFREALRLQPDYPDACIGLGSALKLSGNLQEAETCYREAIRLNPRLFEAHFNLGNTLQQQHNLDGAIESYRKALDHQPDYADAHINLGHALNEQGNTEEALVHYQRAATLKPDIALARWGHCISQIPIFYDSKDAIQIARARYQQELEVLRRSFDLKEARGIEAAAKAVGSRQPFYLAYQGECDREMQTIYGELVSRIQAARYPQWAKAPAMPSRRQNEPLRVGIASGFFYHHSNWKIPIKGWVEKLDRHRFALYGYFTGTKGDAVTDIARSQFRKFVENEDRFDRLCETIRKDRLHVLIYPEIGMDSVTVRLASLRLAPIQCTSWGHPDTSGLPTLDYYLSSDLMEPPDADGHYSERLVRLPNLSICYGPMPIPDVQIERAQLGLRDTGILFLCAQSLFKYLPQYDVVFPSIAKCVGKCQFAFLSYARSAELTGKFSNRLFRAFEAHGLRADEFIIFLPHLEPPLYMALNRLSDVFLDSIGWSGCNSTLEAISCNLPVVTLPGRLMRGRHSYAILKMMGLEETIAKDLDDYVSIAARLATNVGWREEISRAIRERKCCLYGDMACVEGLESFLERAAGERS